MSKIGMGYIGWLSHDEGPDCTTVAWCDINEDKLKKAGRAHPEVALYTDYREMLANPRVDAVVIASPNWLHAEQAIAFLNAGKHVFLEKPMGINRRECDQVLAAARASRGRLAVDFEMRVSAFATRIKELIAGGTHGALRHVEFFHHRGCWLQEGNGLWRVRPERSGGHFLMEPIHEVDILRCFAGEVREVQTVSGRTVLTQYGFPDHFCSHLFFEGGVVATLLVSHTTAAWLPLADQKDVERLAEAGHEMRMFFTFDKAAVTVDFTRARIRIHPIEEYPAGSGGKRVVAGACEEYGDAAAFGHDIAAMRREFIRRCAGGLPMVQEPLDAWRTHVVCLAAERSMLEDGRHIEVNYSEPEH